MPAKVDTGGGDIVISNMEGFQSNIEWESLMATLLTFNCHINYNWDEPGYIVIACKAYFGRQLINLLFLACIYDAQWKDIFLAFSNCRL